MGHGLLRFRRSESGGTPGFCTRATRRSGPTTVKEGRVEIVAAYLSPLSSEGIETAEVTYEDREIFGAEGNVGTSHPRSFQRDNTGRVVRRW